MAEYPQIRPRIRSGTAIPVFGDNRRMKIGLLGGSFNPAHEGHRQIALHALRILRLDQVWLMVSPGNPLKPRKGMALFAQRLATAEHMADGRHIIATDIEQRLGQHYTVKTIKMLKQRFPHVHFVWLMGADGLAQFPKWKNWQDIAGMVPVVVFPRPGTIMPALHGKAASFMRRKRCRSRQAACLLRDGAGRGWAFPLMRQNPLSATRLRHAGLFLPKNSDQEEVSTRGS